ncbi:hypothetical protein BsWGS_07471 [Bradybaena similaris]
MAAARRLFVICLLFLHLDVILAARVNIVRNFKVEIEYEEETLLKQTRQSTLTGDKTIERINATSTDATGLYKLSYEDYGVTWEQFKIDHKRVYKSAREERQRFAIFMDNVKKIERHNWQFHNGLTTYWMDINQFSDWTDEEWRSMLVPIAINATTDSQATSLTMDVGVPDTIDWSQKGYVTGVKNQLSCGSCWAFSTTGSLEGQWFRKKGQLISLSEQQLVDCSGSVGNRGCNGGWVDRSFSYILASKGIEGEADYPYKATQGPCRYQQKFAKASVSGYVNVNPSGNELVLKNTVGSVGPVSVYIYANSNFQSYRGGIFTDSNCNYQINHAVLAVGYGTSGGQDYWLVKNSWGTAWGERGYIRVARNRGNMCQIASYAYYPNV